jgi:hypothetical protein
MMANKSQTTPLPYAFIGLCLGGLIGIAIGSIFGIDREIGRGETDLGEILQWGIIVAYYSAFCQVPSLEQQSVSHLMDADAGRVE